jgi:hypothetical protein
MSQISQTISTGKHVNLSSQYGCRAYMTVATFVVCGIVHRARRFFRADMPTTGRVELYTIESYPGTAITTMTESGWYASAVSEDWLGYAVDGSRVARHAMAALDAVDSMVASDAAERAALVEL